MWFHKKDLTRYRSIMMDELHGYVLPHAGTKYTGDIISHTLRFKPVKKVNKIYIIYYPVSDVPNIDGIYYHEFFVPWKCMEYIFPKHIEFIGINIWDTTNDFVTLLDKFGVEYTNVLDDNGSVLFEYGVRGIPEKYLIDAQGRLVWKFVGPTESDVLKNKIDALLTEY